MSAAFTNFHYYPSPSSLPFPNQSAFTLNSTVQAGEADENTQWCSFLHAAKPAHALHSNQRQTAFIIPDVPLPQVELKAKQGHRGHCTQGSGRWQSGL